MKTLFRFLILIAFIILLSSCSPTPFFYDSTASLPYSHRSTKTVFELMKDSKGTFFEFGVISAKDNDKLSYVLLSPSIEGEYVKELTDVNLTNSVPLRLEQAKEFVEILISSSESWNKKFENTNGISYEFRIAPENQIIPQSENVVSWYSTIKFYFQNNVDGSVATLHFGEGTLKYSYKLETLSEIKDLIDLLNKSIKNN